MALFGDILSKSYHLCFVEDFVFSGPTVSRLLSPVACCLHPLVWIDLDIEEQIWCTPSPSSQQLGTANRDNNQRICDILKIPNGFDRADDLHASGLC